MDSYNFWQDFFDTYQSLSDWLKTLWLIVPPAFILGLVWLWRRQPTRPARVEIGERGRLLYSVYRDADNRTHMVSYDSETVGPSGILLFDPPEIDRRDHTDLLAHLDGNADDTERR